MFCSQCGAGNPDDSRFCSVCGGPLQAQVPPPTAAIPSVPGLAPPYAGAAQTSGKAIASLICGLLFFIFPAAIAAIILGHLSLSDIGKAAGRLKGRGIAVVGLVLGYGGVLFIPFVLIIAAIAIPNLLRARMAANEASAAGSLRTISTAAITYSSEYGNGFPPSLTSIGGVRNESASCDHAQLIERVLASGQKAGYVFTYVPTGSRVLWDDAKARGCAEPGAASFEVHADPVTRGTTGQRSFFTDQTGRDPLRDEWHRDGRQPATRVVQLTQSASAPKASETGVGSRSKRAAGACS
jgi:type IV pilus assembly protein PilA